jgi:hypothetical protein
MIPIYAVLAHVKKKKKIRGIYFLCITQLEEKAKRRQNAKRKNDKLGR